MIYKCCFLKNKKYSKETYYILKVENIKMSCARIKLIFRDKKRVNNNKMETRFVANCDYYNILRL